MTGTSKENLIVNATSGDTNTQVPSGDQESKDFVAYSTYKKVLGQEKSARERLAETERKLSEFETLEKEREEQKLREQGELKKLLALKDEEVKKLKGDNQTMTQQWDEAVKMSALRARLPGAIRDEDCYTIVRNSLKDIVIDPTTGDIVEDSVKAVAENLVKNKIYLFDVKGSANLPGNAPQSPASKITLEQWRELPVKEKREKMGEIYDQLAKK